MLVAVVAIVAVAVLGLLMRRSSVSAVMPARPVKDEAPGDTEPEQSEEPGLSEDEYISDQVVALTSDGIAFIPEGETVRLSQARGPDLDLLRSGDLIHARVVRGAPDHDPWRLEALGRDRELRAWRFETEEPARIALELVERCIVRAPRDENVEEIVIGDADYAEARRLEEEIESELATMPEVEDAAERERRPIQ
jgi:hypothetical protein